MDTKEVKIGRCFTACTGREITSILEIHLMEGASHTIQGILKSVKTRPKIFARLLQWVLLKPSPITPTYLQWPRIFGETLAGCPKYPYRHITPPPPHQAFSSHLTFY